MKKQLNQNVTVSLPRALLKKAKLLAAAIDESLTSVIRSSLEQRVNNRGKYREARLRQIKLLRSGINLGSEGQMNISRDELHER